MSYINLVSSTTSSGQGGLAVANNLRIASISIAAYEFVASSFLLNLLVTFCSASYLTTIPAEFRLYKSTSPRR